MLIPGHEMLGEVTEVGSSVEGLSVGERVVPLVQLPCGKCAPCNADRSDSHGIYPIAAMSMGLWSWK